MSWINWQGHSAATQAASCPTEVCDGFVTVEHLRHDATCGLQPFMLSKLGR
jgi:hypothetical protein